MQETLKDQTIFTQSTRSHTNKGVPIYQNKIYEFDENDVDGIKKFIQENPNLECLIKLKRKSKDFL